MVDVPLSKWGGVNLDNTVLDEGFCSNEFIVGCVVDDVDDSGFSGDGF